MGVTDVRDGQLAPLGVDIPHAGLPDVWTAGRWTSHDELAAARGEFVAVVCDAVAADGKARAEFRGGGVVRLASAARRVGGMDC